MSVEATALSRSRLEQKDRAELAAIVEAMGGKAGSRAKKADLVDQVLELASEGTPSNGARSSREPAPAPAPAASTDAPASEDEPSAEWELAVASDAPATEPTSPT